MSNQKNLRACIVDDEVLARDVLRQMITRNALNIIIVGEADDLDSAVKLVKAEKPDVLFLDIEMPGGNGFDVLKALPEMHMHVVFVTAYNDYALRAIKFHAFDYLLKPLSKKAIMITIEDLSKFLDRSIDKALLKNFNQNFNQKDTNKHSIAVFNSSRDLIFTY